MFFFDYGFVTIPNFEKNCFAYIFSVTHQNYIIFLDNVPLVYIISIVTEFPPIKTFKQEKDVKVTFLSLAWLGIFTLQ